MPFGAEVLPDGGTRFRLWAPASTALALVLEPGSAASCRCSRREDGWFARDHRRAGRAAATASASTDGTRVPDPASRHQPEDVHGPSEVIDPRAYAWQRRRLERPALARGGDLRAACRHVHPSRAPSPALRRRLDHLAGLGVTAIELMPLADFPGTRNWGYDGVLPFAPDAAYGRPEDLKRLIDAAHARG